MLNFLNTYRITNYQHNKKFPQNSRYYLSEIIKCLLFRTFQFTSTLGKLLEFSKKYFAKMRRELVHEFFVAYLLIFENVIFLKIIIIIILIINANTKP